MIRFDKNNIVTLHSKLKFKKFINTLFKKRVYLCEGIAINTDNISCVWEVKG